MTAEDTVPRVQRAAILVALAGTGALLRPGALDPFHLPRASLALVTGAVVLLAAVWGAAQHRSHPWPHAPAVYAGLAFLVAVLLATVTSPLPRLSLVGVYQRNTGLLAYAAYLVLFLGVLTAFSERHLRKVLVAMAVGAGVAGFYGLLQWTGVDPITWHAEFVGAGLVSSTLGNPNFASAYAGIALPVLCWLAFEKRLVAGLRLAALPLGLLTVVLLLAARSLQGLIAGAAGVAVFVLVLAVPALRDGSTRARRASAVVAGAGGLAFVTALGAVGPRLLEHPTFMVRREYWAAAGRMLRDHPVTGVGMDLFGGFLRQYQSPAFALHVGLTEDADAPHNVVVGMFASGGVLLGLSYLAFVLLVGVALVQAAWRAERRSLALVAGLGGAWVAYQVQSLASMDVPALAITHWTVAGGIVVLSGSVDWRTLGKPPQPQRGKPGRRGRPPQAPRLVTAGLVVILLAVLWAVSLPLRADRAAGQAVRSLEGGIAPLAWEEFERANRLAPWEPQYWWHHAGGRVAAGQVAEALPMFEATVERYPRFFPAVLLSARTADHLGNPPAARAWYERAVVLEPNNPDLRLEFARLLLRLEQTPAARQQLQEGLARNPGNEQLQGVLDEVGG